MLSRFEGSVPDRQRWWEDACWVMVVDTDSRRGFVTANPFLQPRSGFAIDGSGNAAVQCLHPPLSSTHRVVSCRAVLCC